MSQLAREGSAAAGLDDGEESDDSDSGIKIHKRTPKK